MKKVLLFTMAIAFTAVSSLSAQTMPSVKSTDLKKASTELSSSQTDQIKEAEERHALDARSGVYRRDALCHQTTGKCEGHCFI